MSECCQAMAKCIREWNRPFFYPTYIGENRDIRADRLAISLWNVTKRGRMSQKQGWATISYCPFCGKRLKPEDADG